MKIWKNLRYFGGGMLTSSTKPVHTRDENDVHDEGASWEDSTDIPSLRGNIGFIALQQARIRQSLAENIQEIKGDNESEAGHRF